MINSGFTAKWVVELTEQFITELTMKHLETGYADNQPKWPYWVRPRNYASKDWHEMSLWMLDTFGDSNWLQENALWVGSDYKYWFRREQDRTLFILKWS
jgi:hypothetical protein